MERINEREQNRDLRVKRHSRSGRILAGLILVAVGGLFLARQMGAPVPGWLFSWQSILIVVGFFMGAKSGFRGFGWAAPILLGVVFLINDMMPGLNIHRYFWPLFIMVIGLFFIFKPKKHCGGSWSDEGELSSEDKIEANAVFGGVKKNVISKNFRGGEINAVFGGTEINLTQADFQGRVELESNNIFGGTKLLIPEHWTVVSEMTAIMGGIEDKRPLPKDGPDPGRVLVLKGSCIMGGLEIKSY